jgi:hypothetical protein
MNGAYWFVAGLFTGWIVTCLSLAISVNDSTRIGRLLWRLRLFPTTQPPDQDQKKKQQTGQRQQQDKSQGNFER